MVNCILDACFYDQELRGVSVNSARCFIALILIILIPISFFSCSMLPGDGTDPFSSSVLLASSALTVGGGSAIVMTGVVFTLSIGSMPGGPGVFDNLVLTPDQTGSSYTIVSSDDEDFFTVTETLTNGVDEYITFSFTGSPPGGGGAVSTTESGFFLGGVTGEYQPDFTGFEIDYFKLTINALTLDVPGSNPNGDGIWTGFSIDFQVEVYGHSI